MSSIVIVIAVVIRNCYVYFELGSIITLEVYWIKSELSREYISLPHLKLAVHSCSILQHSLTLQIYCDSSAASFK